MLSLITYKKLTNWSVRFLSNPSLAKTHYPKCQLGELLHRNQKVIVVNDNKKYKRITIKLYGNGVCLRDEVFGRDIGTKRQYVISKGQFILSKIDARNGAFGIVPEELDGAITTADFASFDINIDRVIPDFLSLLVSTKNFLKMCQAQSSGTTGRQRLSLNDLRQIDIPLPSIDEQKVILKNYNESYQLSTNLKKHAYSVFCDLSLFFKSNLGIKEMAKNKFRERFKTIRFSEINKWSIAELSKTQNYLFDASKFQVMPVGDLVTQIDGGHTPSTANSSYWQNADINWASAKDIKYPFLNTTKDKITELAVRENTLKIHPAGTVIAVFRSGILRRAFPICISEIPVTINQDLKAIRVNNSFVLNKYFLFYFYFMQQMVLDFAMKTGVTVESIDMDSFLQIPVVVPSIATQRLLVNTTEKQLNIINELEKKSSLQKEQAFKVFQTALFHKDNLPCA